MRFFLLILITLSSSFTACASRTLTNCTAARGDIAGKIQRGCVVTDNSARTYQLYIPKNLDHSQPTRLLLALHGGGEKPKSFRRYSQLETEMKKSDTTFIIVYPTGFKKHWNDGRQNSYEDKNDLLFLADLIVHLKDTVTLNISSTFIAGMSNGALMANSFACHRPDLIHGVATVAGTMSYPDAKACQTGKPLPSLVIFGNKDTTFLNSNIMVNPINPSKQIGRHIGIANTLSTWKKRNNCTEPANILGPLNPVKNDHTSYKITLFDKCLAPVKYIEIIGGGHRWADPTAKNGWLIVKKLNLGYASHDISAAKGILEFFKQF